MDEGALEVENHQQTEMKTMARTYRNTPETKQKTKRRKSKKNKASWRAFREQHRHSKAMESSKHMNVAKVVCR
tara:strand:+ start:306 stop:524 length:219 start_codon:yes stop_codon:yes gene_type:complete